MSHLTRLHEHSSQDGIRQARGVRRLADFTNISAGRAPCDRGIIPQLSLVLYMTRAQRRTAQAPSMLHRSGNPPLHPSEILHRPTVAARSSRRGQAPARDHAEPDCDRSEAQISRSPGGSRVAPIVLVAPYIDLSFEDDLGRLLRLGNGAERLLCTNGSRADTKSRAIFARLRYAAIILAVCRPRLLRGLSCSFRPGSFQLDLAWRSR